jgi:hypothetical protein
MPQAAGVEGGEGEAVALAFLADQQGGRGIEADLADGVRRHRLEGLGADAVGLPVDEEHRQALMSLGVGAAGEDGVEAGDAGVGDEGLDARQAPEGPVGFRPRPDRRQIRSRVGFGDRESAHQLAVRHRGQPAGLLHVGPGQADRVGAEALHGEGGVGQRGEVGEALAHHDEGTEVHEAVGRRHGGAENVGLCQQQRDLQSPLRGVGLVGGLRTQPLLAEGAHALAEIEVLRFEEWISQESLATQHSPQRHKGHKDPPFSVLFVPLWLSVPFIRGLLRTSVGASP